MLAQTQYIELPTGQVDPSLTIQAPLNAAPADLILQGRYAEAFPLLERKVMLEPDNIEAWIDYAHTVDALGRHEDARAIREFIVQELTLDAASRRRLAALGPRSPALLPAHQWRGEISLLTGKESNANAGPSVRDITFYQRGEEPITLLLSEQSRPKPSASHLVEARLESGHTLGGGLGLSTSLDLRQRNTPSAPQAGSRQWQADLALTLGGYRTQDSARQWLLSASLQDYDYGSATLIRRQRVGAGIDQSFGLRSSTPCRIQSTLEYEWRQHPAYDKLKTNLGSAQFAAVCARDQHRWMGLLRVGVDHPGGARAGGDQIRRDFSLGYRLDLNRWGQAEIQTSYSESKDGDVYNELFGFVRRRTARNQLSVSYTSAPFFGSWRAIARAETFRQRSNISLFRMRGHSFHAGLRYSF